MKKIFSVFAYIFFALCLITSCGTEEDPATSDKPKPDPNVPEEVEEVKVSPETLELVVGRDYVLSVIVLPEDAEYDKIYWSSSDESVAVVTESGRVSAIAEGSAEIIAKAGDKQGKCHVVTLIESVPVKSITLSDSSLRLTENDVYTLTATITPSDATDKNINWTSSNTDVATVDYNGNVTAIKIGTTTITASCGGKSAICTVTVTTKGNVDATVKPWEDDGEDYGGTVN